MNSSDYDVVVIGAGSAGYAAARTAARFGMKTLVVEGGREVGGLCILRGCMPTKALLHAAEIRHLARKASVWGLRIHEVGFDWTAVLRRRDEVIREFTDFRVGQLNRGDFDFVRGFARLVGPHEIKLDGGPAFRGRHLIIATGSVVSPAPLEALKTTGYVTSDEALNHPAPPESLVVLGGGAVAVEFAQLFSRFGSRVTLIQRSGRILRGLDEDAARVVEESLRREGIEVFTGTRLVSAGREGNRIHVEFEHAGARRRAEGETLLHAMGRQPAINGLGLESAGVHIEGGRIVTSDDQQTSVPHIHAAGDCCGPYDVVHLAVQQGEVAAYNIANPERPRRIDHRLRLSVVFSDPAVATVGLTEQAAMAEGIRVIAASHPFADHGRSILMDALEGFVKLVARADTGEVVGAVCAGPSAGELIHEMVPVLATRMTVHRLAMLPHYHPTLAEIWTYPAEDLAARLPGASA